MIITLIKYFGNDDNMSIMEEQFDITYNKKNIIYKATIPLTGGVSECDLAHRRSVAVLYMLNKIRCNPMHPLYGALIVPYVPVRVTPGTVIAHRHSSVPPRCRTSQYPMNYSLVSISV